MRSDAKPSLRILRNLFRALCDPAGVLSHRPGAFERVQLLLEDWAHTQHKLADIEQRMLAVLNQLERTELVTSITGISAVGAATILAETGDPRRFATARTLVKHAGLAPREKLRRVVATLPLSAVCQPCRACAWLVAHSSA
jgi:transposase